MKTVNVIRITRKTYKESKDKREKENSSLTSYVQESSRPSLLTILKKSVKILKLSRNGTKNLFILKTYVKYFPLNHIPFTLESRACVLYVEYVCVEYVYCMCRVCVLWKR